MAVLLKYMVLIEPDLQQLSKLVLESVEELNGNQFKASASLLGLLEKLRRASQEKDVALETQLVIRERRLELLWGEESYVIILLAGVPSTTIIDQLAIQLKHKSEMADPGLLRARNEKISFNLESAKESAALEMAELESILERKKRELWVTSRQAETDSLTGLYNRGAYDSRLKSAIVDCKRKSLPMCLILMDLDYFKEINDSYGHQYGDEYLKKMANIMRNSCRTETDSACRIGGDEFAIIMLATVEVACRVAEKILSEFDNKVSVGVCELKASDDIKSFFSRCDEALYSAKEAGRGQVAAA